MTNHNFIDNDFLLQTNTAKILYNNFARNEPILDYHNHLCPKDIAEDRQFENITQIWIEGDHYKWRAMRANGIDEKFITGDASDLDKFKKWAETVPYTLRNPLYHWTHMELQIYFGLNELLSAENAEEIYHKCNKFLQKPEYSVKNLLRKLNVKVVGTTDDPTDDLAYHKKLQEDKFEIKVLPTFRPDKFINIENHADFLLFLEKLEDSVGYSISNYYLLLKALDERHAFFHEMGGRISDHGHSNYFFETTTVQEVDQLFLRLKNKETLTPIEMDKYKTHTLLEMAKMNHERGWTQQFHVGVIRNNNSRMKKLLGPDYGFDSVGSLNKAEKMSLFLDSLNTSNQLTKTIVYNLNSNESEMIAAMIANFNEGPIAGKMQYGAAWWFLDQKLGMENQMEVLSNYGLLSRFIGMVTDSRSFMSFSRHDYFRRILCNLIGNDIENGLLPNNMELIGGMVKNICYGNAANYLKI
jgi:glucuronate isomerase